MTNHQCHRLFPSDVFNSLSRLRCTWMPKWYTTYLSESCNTFHVL